MKTTTLFLVLIIAALAGAGGWFAAKRSAKSAASASGGGTGRKILYYQSPMHPWIKSDAPGNCTICGMKLVPVHEGEKGFAGEAEGVTTLGSNIIQVINVQAEEITRRPLVRTLRVAGTIQEDETKHRRLSAYADGRIEKLFVNYVGAEVVAGEPLATIYSPVLLTVESDYLTILRQTAGSSGSANLVNERGRLLEAAAQRLKRLGYTDEQIRALADKASATAYSNLLAPMTGTVVVRNVFEGQYVKEGDLLFELADLSRMWFQFDAYERDLAWLQAGQQVEVTTPAIPGKVFSAPIAFIDPNLNDMTRSARVRVELENPVIEEGGRKRRLFLRQMYADGTVKVQTPEVLAVPRSAILAGGSQPIAYVDLGGGAYEQRRLKLGRLGDDFREVLEGVAAGERVVTTGNLLIDSQAQLNATASPMPQTAAPDQQSGAAMPASAESLAGLTEEQAEVVRKFLAFTSELGAGLAADSLDRYNEHAPHVHASIPALINALGNVKSLRPALQKLEQSGHLGKEKDLAAARKQFLPFSMAAVELAKELRKTEPFKSTRIYNCPMVNQAIPGAAKNGQWIQLQPPLRNPFFGDEMLECGVEVKP